MSKTEIATMISGLNLPFTYDFFPNNAAPEPPYIVFNYPSINDFIADNSNYAKINVLNLELYCRVKDFDLEGQIESMLQGNGFVYTKEESYIRKENLYQITYVSEFTE